LFTLTALACVLAAGNVAAQQFTMKVSSASLNDVNHEVMKALKAGIESRSGGRIKVDLYPASQLGPLPRTIEGVALGTVEMEFPPVSFLVGMDRRYVVFDVPGLFDDIQHGHRALADPEIRKRIATLGAARGVESMYIALSGPLMLLSHKPVRSVDDLKGQKIRLPGGTPLQVEPFRKLGVSPVTMAPSEMMPAMQNRAIDGFLTGFPILTAFKYYDVAKDATHLPGSYLMLTGLMNRNFLKSLGPQLEGVVREEVRKAETLYTTFGVEDVGRIRATWEKNGGRFIEMSPAESKRYIQEVTAALPPILAAEPQLKDDYEALAAAARRHRQ
jgi:C4-dicarboxylate-binding protein DctP